MLTTRDEGVGLVRTYWENVRERVRKVSPEFAKIVDELSPDKSFPLYLAYYPYGELKGDTISSFLPKIDGGYYRLIDPSAPKEIVRNLGYGRHSAPFGMLLEKTLEYFVDLKELGITIPWCIYSPGAFFPLGRMLLNKSDRVYSPNAILTVSSGARSVFMLPKIGCAANHLMLRRNYNVQPQPPRSLYDHWKLFKEIVASDKDASGWRSCTIYFSKKWVDKIADDIAWHPLRRFLIELAWRNYEYDRNHVYYDVAYSLIQNKKNLKPNPYLVDTARHLFAISLGAMPGYVPACNDEFLPLSFLQKAFVNSYGLKKYIPTIMQPTHFVFENTCSDPVYYSMQFPGTVSFSPKSRKVSSTLFEMRELKYILNVFNAELISENNILSDTVMSSVAHNVNFDFFHCQNDIHGTVQDSSLVIKDDARFSFSSGMAEHGAVFSREAPFLRGCIRISIKNKTTATSVTTTRGPNYPF